MCSEEESQQPTLSFDVGILFLRYADILDRAGTISTHHHHITLIFRGNALYFGSRPPSTLLTVASYVRALRFAFCAPLPDLWLKFICSSI